MLGYRYDDWLVVAYRADDSPLVRRADGTGDRHRLLLYSSPYPWALDAAGFDHPGFVRLVDGTTYYWVLDDARSTPITGLLDEPLPLEAVAALARGVLEPLAALHARPQGHERLDTRHVVVDPSGRVRVVPPLPPGDRPTPDLWMVPPELIIAMEGAIITRAADVYAVAALLYRALTGRPPFTGADTIERIRAVVEGRIAAPLGALVPGLPIEFERAIEQALSLEPTARPPDAAALWALLEPVLPDAETATAALLQRLAVDEVTPRESLEPPPPPPAPRPAAAPPVASVIDHGPHLPRALEPWRDALSLFPEDLALSVGSMVRRVARVFGPLRLEADVASGVPDGYRGVARRGPFDRLLLSEWAIALEVPEEFVRRAAMGEQLFTALAHKRPGGVRRSVALFDAGPESLGRPRIAQLAVLIALAARAQAAGLRFAWGLLEDDRRAQISELNTASVLRLLQGRTWTPATPVDGTEWSLALGDAQEADDLWVIGPRSLASLSTLTGGTRVYLADGEPGARTVELALERPRAAPRQVELELPAEADCARLLREPFARRAPPPAPTSTPRSQAVVHLAFEPAGRRLIELSDDGTALATHIPRTGRETTPRPLRRAPPEGGRVLAATMAGNRLFTVEPRDGELVVRRSGAGGGTGGQWSVMVPPEAFRAMFGEVCADLALECRGRVPERVFLRGRDGVLWRGAPDGVLESLATGVVGMCRVDAWLYYAVALDDRRVRLMRLVHDTREVMGEWRYEEAPALVAGVSATAMPGPGVAVRVTERTWVYPGSDPLSVSGRAVAVAHHEGRFAMVVVMDDRRTLALASGAGRSPFYTAAAPIVHVAPNPRARTLACLDEAGRLVVVDLRGWVSFARD